MLPGGNENKVPIDVVQTGAKMVDDERIYAYKTPYFCLIIKNCGSRYSIFPVPRICELETRAESDCSHRIASLTGHRKLADYKELP